MRRMLWYPGTKNVTNFPRLLPKQTACAARSLLIHRVSLIFAFKVQIFQVINSRCYRVRPKNTSKSRMYTHFNGVKPASNKRTYRSTIHTPVYWTAHVYWRKSHWPSNVFCCGNDTDVCISPTPSVRRGTWDGAATPATDVGSYTDR